MKYYRRSELKLDEEITTFKENIGEEEMKKWPEELVADLEVQKNPLIV